MMFTIMVLINFLYAVVKLCHAIQRGLNMLAPGVKRSRPRETCVLSSDVFGCTWTIIVAIAIRVSYQ